MRCRVLLAGCLALGLGCSFGSGSGGDASTDASTETDSEGQPSGDTTNPADAGPVTTSPTDASTSLGNPDDGTGDGPGDTGTAGDDSGGTASMSETTGGETSGPGMAPYGPCIQDAPEPNCPAAYPTCNRSSECAPSCMDAGDCPVPETGSPNIRCGMDGLCYLLCQEGFVCPNEMSCAVFRDPEFCHWPRSDED
ncbi:MAG: hypothetical protein JKY37_06255 [Nannocystaceae bacterium]|nr:hypothetical protein [Nannocystaceae bacterium]